MAHEYVTCAIELHQAHGLEVDIEQLAQPTALTQPALSGQLRARRGHAPQNDAQHRRTLRPGQPQLLQQGDEIHPGHRPQPHRLDPNRPWAAQRQRVDLDAVHRRDGVRRRLRGAHALACQQQRRQPLRLALDQQRAAAAEQDPLATEDLLHPRAKRRPVRLRHREMPPQVEQR